MKFKIFSDIHLEFSDHNYDHLWTPSEENKDQILILAGDIDVGNCAAGLVSHACEHFKEVILVCGNHEFYGRDFNTVIEDWRRIEQEGPKNFHFLNNDYRIIDGMRILGGTMWTSFNNADPLLMRQAKNDMNDYRRIFNGGVPITPMFILEQHYAFREFLEETLKQEHDGKTVVVSHHSPGNSVKRRGIVDQLDGCYFADLEKFIGDENKIALWFHGHSHYSYDYLINETRVIGNPFGYYGYALNPNFDKDLIVEI
jgi:hypothetical protein